MVEKVKTDTAGQLYTTLLKSAGDPIVYDAVVDKIIDKFKTDKNFVDAVHKETGISEDKILQEIANAASTPPNDIPLDNHNKNSATHNPDGLAPVKDTSMPSPAAPPSHAPGIAQPQSAAPPQKMQQDAAVNQAEGMSPGQALNVANQQPKPMMKSGGDVKGSEKKVKLPDGSDFFEPQPTDRKKDKDKEKDKPFEGIGAKKGGLLSELKDGGDVDEIDLIGEHSPGMLGGGLMTMPSFNNSVEMAKGGYKDNIDIEDDDDNVDEDSKEDAKNMRRIGGIIQHHRLGFEEAVSKPWKERDKYDRRAIEYWKDSGWSSKEDDKEADRKEMAKGGMNDVPAGALPEEVADDQPTMLSKGEFVMPANVVRYIGLETLMKLRDKALAGLERMEAAGQIRRPGDGKNPGEAGEVKPMKILGDETPIHELVEEHAIEEIKEHTKLLQEIESLEHGEEDPDDLYLKNGGSLADIKPGSTLALKTQHLNHNKGYGHNSGLSYNQPGGGPNEPGMASGGMPSDNTTGIDPNPTARRGAVPPDASIGRNMGKKDPTSFKKPHRAMAGGGDVSDIEEAGKYLNSRDNDDMGDKESHRDSLPGYENFGDWAKAVASTPNIFGAGVIVDAINGRGLFNNNWNSDYLTTKELREGQTHIGKALSVDENATVPSYDDDIQENAKEIMGHNTGGNAGKDNADISSPEPGIGRDE